MDWGISIKKPILLFLLATVLLWSESSFGIFTGRSSADMRWSISGPSGEPNILSELTFRDLEGSSVAFEYEKKQRTFFWNVSVANTVFSDGTVQDSDYYSSNRQDEFSRSYSSLKDSFMNEIMLQVGKMYKNKTYEGVTYGPYFELSRKKSHYKITNGVQAIPATGAFNGLDSFYEQVFNSNSLGVRVEKKDNKNSFNLSLSYGIVEYKANANWNLRDDLAHPKSFEHEASGNVQKIAFGYQHARGVYDLVVRAERSTFEANDGTKTTYYSDGDKYESPFNTMEESVTTVWLGVNFRL